MRAWADLEHLGACRPDNNGGVDVGHLFFGEEAGTRRALPQREAIPTYRAAKAICARCPVREACLSHHLATEPKGGRWGVVGGKTGDERDVLAGDKLRRCQWAPCGAWLSTTRRRYCDASCATAAMAARGHGEFRCPSCPKRCASKGALGSHVRAHHPVTEAA